AVVRCTGLSNGSSDGEPVNGEASAATLTALDEMIETDPANGEYRKRRSRAYARRRLYYLAERELRAAAQSQPDDPALPLLRLQLRLERGDKLDLAALPLEQVETLADMYLIESVRRQGAGAADAALVAVDWALKLRPNRMDLVFHRANVLLTS